jgi:cell division protein FtsB
MIFKQDAGFLKRLALIMASIILLLLLVNGIVGKGGFVDLRKMEEQNQALKQKIEKYKQENQQLVEEINALKTQPRKIIDVARDQYNMVGKGEVKITVSPIKPAKPPHPSPNSK